GIGRLESQSACLLSPVATQQGRRAMPAAIQFLRRHAVALLVTALAFVFTLFLWPLSHRFPFALFIAAVLASAWQGGPRSALITTILSGAILFGLYWLFSAEQMAELGFDYL